MGFAARGVAHEINGFEQDRPGGQASFGASLAARRRDFSRSSKNLWEISKNLWAVFENHWEIFGNRPHLAAGVSTVSFK
ncbi:MAG: hypothetical protein LBI92_08110 [Azoarcus sp.]|nr:hypothetical protein [Azoarcus sp.]